MRGPISDCLLCMVSSQDIADPWRVALMPSDIDGGTLRVKSYIRLTYLVSLSQDHIRRIGSFSRDGYAQVIANLTPALQSGPDRSP